MLSILGKLFFLFKFPPELWDIIHPPGPKFSNALREYLMAGIIRDISNETTNKEISDRLSKAGRQMVEYASKNLVNGWQDGDDYLLLSPPFPWSPFPYPEPNPFPWYSLPFDRPGPSPWFTGSFAALNPQPLPPSQIASVLNVLAGMTSVPEVAEQLKNISGQINNIR